MTHVNINGRTWTLGDAIGSGGFGKVYAVSCGNEHAVIKLVPKAPGARRELLFADDLRGLQGIVPVMGVGEAEGHYTLLMPRARHSLRTVLSASGRLNYAESFPIMLDIADALVRLAERKVVHRDLKPENILMLGDVWCLSDFGISRYAEATTETETRKGLTTRPYNAPEQWRDERATSAADVYAWGVICHELLSGTWPFGGPDFREQHLHAEPPSLTGVSPSLAALVHQCLSKPPGARPSPQDLSRRLTKLFAEKPVASGLSALREAIQVEATRQGNVQTRESRKRSADELHAELAKAAHQQFEAIRNEVLNAIASEIDAPIFDIMRPPDTFAGEVGTIPMGKELRLGAARLQIHNSRTIGFPYGQPWSYHKTKPPLDLVAATYIAAGCPSLRSPAASVEELLSMLDNPGGYIGRAHSLWYCDAVRAGEYGWFETAFIGSKYALDPKAGFPYGDSTAYIFVTDEPSHLFSGEYAPIAQAISTDAFFTESNDDLDAALGDSPTNYHLAWPFTPLVAGDMSEFIDRWAAWFAQSSRHSLRRPQRFPERDPSGSWRGAPTPMRPALQRPSSQRKTSWASRLFGG